MMVALRPNICSDLSARLAYLVEAELHTWRREIFDEFQRWRAGVVLDRELLVGVDPQLGSVADVEVAARAFATGAAIAAIDCELARRVGKPRGLPTLRASDLVTFSDLDVPTVSAAEAASWLH